MTLTALPPAARKARCSLTALEEELRARHLLETNNSTTTSTRLYHETGAGVLYMSYSVPMMPHALDDGFFYQWLESAAQRFPGRRLTRDEADSRVCGGSGRAS